MPLVKYIELRLVSWMHDLSNLIDECLCIEQKNVTSQVDTEKKMIGEQHNNYIYLYYFIKLNVLRITNFWCHACFYKYIYIIKMLQF